MGYRERREHRPGRENGRRERGYYVACSGRDGSRAESGRVKKTEEIHCVMFFGVHNRTSAGIKVGLEVQNIS